MWRIAIIGNGGGGKSTLARTLGRHLRIPVHEVDEVQWLSGWRRAPLDAVAQTLEAWADEDVWVIDGFGPWPVIDRRMGRLTRSCTSIFLCDLICGGLRSVRCFRSCEVRRGPDRARLRHRYFCSERSGACMPCAPISST